MADRRKAFSWDHPVILTFLIIAVVASMSLAAEVLKPLALAILLSFALAPVVRGIERLGAPRGLAVVLTVVTALGALGGIGYVVGHQLTTLANQLPGYEKNIMAKVQLLKPPEESALERATKVASDVARSLDEPKLNEKLVDVRVVSQPSFRERLATALGPYLEMVGIGFIVLILVLFLLLNREDLRDRILQLFGKGRITLTTRTMDEVGQRISRYLGMLAMVNTTIGLIVGVGLWAIGLPYAVLWGFLAGALRFIPYAGPATAFVLPLIFSIAHFPSDQWLGPVEVFLLFALLELAANTFVEPVIYGKTTGVSAIGLLVAAMFWTWLWGALGLLLSTPLTVCLAVLGKYVPSLGFFATMLGEEAELGPDLRYYQRLLAFDQDGATEIIETALKQQPRVEVFDQILIPSLYRTERDYELEALDDREQAFVWRVTSDLLEELEGTDEAALPQLSAASAKAAAPATNGPPEAEKTSMPVADGSTAGENAEPRTLKLVGLSTSDTGDALILRMLAIVLKPAGQTLEVVAEIQPALKVADRLAGQHVDALIVSHLPPAGMAPARYLTRRLRARFPELPLIVGRWTRVGNATTAAEKLESAGATHVVFTLAEARDQILQLARPRTASPVASSSEPAPA